MPILHSSRTGDVRGVERSPGRRVRSIVALVAVVLLSGPGVVAGDFEERLARVDHALKKNPSRSSQMTLESCLSRRNFAYQLYEVGQTARAERSLKFCFTVLKIPEKVPVKAVETSESRELRMQTIQERAAVELEQALALSPDIANGLSIYRGCAMCHEPEGWGLTSGLVPQIAGQHRTVVIKQLADLRAGHRDSVVMIPYATVEVVGGTQSVADVAGYVDTLEISTGTGKGPGDNLELGEALYAEHCVRCHGAAGEGNAEEFVPRIQSQHYQYLVRQFEWIRDGKRRNANAEMVTQIANFEDVETQAVLDYVSRLEPPAELQAPAGWQNPDFEGQRPYSSSAR